ncbi:hypothetical protein [Leyella stercorea]|uniref:hypothetical protein n=1 Tax=Leyella stercorea TaxID=363265 RepID=UPI00243074A6|nr:hypothetical protein [Leyella stercorea]
MSRKMIAKTKNVLGLIIISPILLACVVIFFQEYSEGTRRTELIETTQPIQDYQIVSGWTSSGKHTTYYVEIKWQGRNFSSILLPDSISYAYSRDSIFWAPLYRLHYYYDKHDDEIFCKEKIDVMKDLFLGVFFLLLFLVNLFFQIIEYRDLHKK